LQKQKVVRKSGLKYFWAAQSYPSAELSFRGTGFDNFTLICDGRVVGIVDANSAYWFTHPEAIYLQNGISFFVEKLDIEKKEVLLTEKQTEYYTQANRNQEFELLEKYQTETKSDFFARYGFVKVVSQVIGYTKKKYHTNEILSRADLDLPSTEYATTAFWLALSDDLIGNLKKKDLWNNEKNYYGPNWQTITKQIKIRDKHTCQNCGKESNTDLDVHHKKPFKHFSSVDKANNKDNLITLCKSCHRKAEQNVLVQSGLAGFKYLMKNLSPVFLMCDRNDIQVGIEEQSAMEDGLTLVIFFDTTPGGTGLSKKLFSIRNKLYKEGVSVIEKCDCKTGCPACVGPVAENGIGAKTKTLALIKALLPNQNG
jgi:DEAD/DEAH box helicase domain-containing protein